VTLADEKVEQPAHERVFKVPSYRTAAAGEAEALETLAHMLGGGATSVLYETLVVDRKLAVSAGAYYAGSAVDDTRFWVYATPAHGVSLEALDAAIDATLKNFVETPIDPERLRRSKTRLVADATYAQDSQVSLARWYGEALATGLTIADVVAWPDRMEAVAAADVTTAAQKWLDKRRAVTGFLLPEPA
jgi:zinc protease